MGARRAARNTATLSARLASRALGDHGEVAMTEQMFAELVAAADPELRRLVGEHLRDCDGLLVHVLCGDLSRYCVATWDRGDAAAAQRCLAVVADGRSADWSAPYPVSQIPCSLAARRNAPRGTTRAKPAESTLGTGTPVSGTCL
jgi:hypothetical protein